MAYTFKYKLNRAPEPRTDGAGCILHDIYAVVFVDGVEGNSIRHKDGITIPNAELEAVLATGTNAQKIAAYKNTLVSNLHTQPMPNQGWSIAEMTAFMEANTESLVQADAADEFITVTLGQSYPVTFDL